MKIVWKFPLETVDEQIIRAPADWEPLSVQLQDGIPCMWAAVESTKAHVQYRVWIHGTGHPMPGVDRQFVGTFQIPQMDLVFHVFVERGF